jgi:hypothetical protein
MNMFHEFSTQTQNFKCEKDLIFCLKLNEQWDEERWVSFLTLFIQTFSWGGNWSDDTEHSFFLACWKKKVIEIQTYIYLTGGFNLI